MIPEHRVDISDRAEPRISLSFTLTDYQTLCDMLRIACAYQPALMRWRSLKLDIEKASAVISHDIEE